MFSELAFDSGSDTDNAIQHGAIDDDKSRQLEGESCGAIGGTVRLHRPGEEGFSCVAGGDKDTDALLDARLVSGDSWLDDKCHCIRCETVQASTRLTSLQQRCKGKLVVVLLDLDNYGFNQFKSIPPGSGSSDGFDLLKHVFVWSFFGSCFTRYHGVFPDAENVCQSSPQHDGVGKRSAKRSVWQRLVAEGRCHFTPCGGHSQAADAVMVQVAHAMTHVPTVVLSGDRELLQDIHNNRRLVGKKASRETAAFDFLSQLDIVNVLEHGKRFVPVWRALEARIRLIVQQ
ncbi:hypothetical protein DQ04_00091230 [Trypanosoma grayi]|uniref:hypothetical protein n=1 Tax=Trypanosoma grayi TaxID=71804 RepID=UPI0004F43EA9|nr:hypothetical protein DQ04_00091230 [Trypanosoma grayi]KEG15389.1 hypothetical protein DQ04_00091230 [Trypanosoma grayi]